MDIPMHGRNPTFHTPLPEICVQDSHHPDRYLDRYSDQPRYHSTPSTPAAGPMSIPNAREAPPPPLPPPRYIPDISENGRGDLGWQWANQHRDINWEGSISSVPAGSVCMGVMLVAIAYQTSDQILGVEEAQMPLSPHPHCKTRVAIRMRCRKMKDTRVFLLPTQALVDTVSATIFDVTPQPLRLGRVATASPICSAFLSRNSISFAVHDAYQN
ncbi:hypothetical protein DID88_002014 [Monilinia fructigena]|uniref:Uncharacterized protein n=1 Tax=Monilinia fructigena TaxID=38457 RepID=A0A395IW74_9HELO|nr:hypothetical protein DID88_002014 [Monilinia fructigena]